MKNNKIISIVGSTASGKTSFALDLAKKILHIKKTEILNLDSFLQPFVFDGIDLISVDSRQVYKGLEVLSGADIPNDFKFQRKHDSILYDYYKHKSFDISLHGVSILDLNEEWSVAHFRDFAIQVILQSFKNNRLSILVGGTGLYHQQLLSSDKNLYVSPNKKIREKANQMSIEQLQTWLKKVNFQRLEEMNNSDFNNPRRLIRAIEITLGQSEQPIKNQLPDSVKLFTLGIEVDLHTIENKITQRVNKRFNQGAIDEVHNLQKICQKKDLPICSSLGVSDIVAFLSGKLDEAECQKEWSLHEFQYAKRQVTWFKKQPDIIWIKK